MSSNRSSKPALTAQRESNEADVPEWARSPESGSSEGAVNEAPPVEPDGQADNDAASDQPERVQGSVVGTSTPAMDNLLEWLAAVAVTEDEDNLASLEAIVREALSADSMETVLRQKMASNAEQWLGSPLLLTGFTIRESDYTEGQGLPFYASLQVVAGVPPESRIINCGGIKVLAQVKRLHELGEWPVPCRIVEAAKAKKGKNAPLTLVPLEQ